jgi:serine/threonine-protein kinase HipA
MKKKPGKALGVHWADGRLIGHLVHPGPIYFTYSPEWLGTGSNLSPLLLPFDGRPFNNLAEGCFGLPGFIADALPDTWGNRVAEAFFARRGWGAVTPMKLLAWIGDRAPGALSFQPATLDPAAPDWLEHVSAEHLALEAREILRGAPSNVAIAMIAQAGGSAGGAQPKALVVVHLDGSISLTRLPLSPGDRPAVLKLDLPELPPLAKVEHVYLQLAAAAGIDVPRSQLIGPADRPHLLIDRFDWQEGRRLLLHSLSGIWHRPKAGLDYSDLFRAIARLGLPKPTIVQAARRLLFNLYAVNHDDHGRNHAFLYDDLTRTWKLSPAYDLTYTPGMLSRGLTIAGEVHPTIETVAAFLATVAIDRTETKALLDQVLLALATFPALARAVDLPAEKSAEIAAAHQSALVRSGRLA